MLLDIKNLTKSYSTTPLFDGISFTVNEGEKIGLIGPNGAGKSTLLKIIGDMERPDDGSVDKPPAVRIAYLSQSEHFKEGQTVEDIAINALSDSIYTIDEITKQTRVRILLSKLGFKNRTQTVETLSGGWQKRLSVACQLVKEPDLLLLDEPTNHLDIAGISWLEDYLENSSISYIVVSHDRYLLERITTRIIELNPIYDDGYFSVDGVYSDFLEKRQDLIESKIKFERTLANKVREEITWLRKGPRARATKANYRIKAAGEMIDSLAVTRRQIASDTKVDIEFNSTRRHTKQLIVAEGIEKTLSGKKLFSDIEIVVSPGDRIGIVGNNGSGKTTLMRIFQDELAPDKGRMKFYHQLRTVYFRQDRSDLDETKSLREALAPDGDNFAVDEKKWHVVGWAKRFLFPKEQLPLAVSELSGGEQARVLIANLMRTPCDVLLLDEPTNDLDIPSIEVLEDSLKTFHGAVIIVTHDRHMIDNLCDTVIGLHENGDSQMYASVSQWANHEKEYNNLANSSTSSLKKGGSSDLMKQDHSTLNGVSQGSQSGENSGNIKKKPLISRDERKELAAIEKKIEKEEDVLEGLKEELLNPGISTQVELLQELSAKVENQEDKLAAMYARWEELGQKQEADDERVRLNRLNP